MGYTIPLRFIKVSGSRKDGAGQFDVAICATRIVAMMSTHIYQARRTVTTEKKAGTLINAAGNEKVETAIFLDNGSVVASPLTVRRLLTLIEKSNKKAAAQKQSKRIEVFDVVDKEPEETDEEDIDDVSAIYDVPELNPYEEDD